MRIDRLQQLYDHMLSDNVGHKVFDFTCYDKGFQLGKNCGTSGCMAGECPILWPNDWMFFNGEVILREYKDSNYEDTEDSLQHWFDLSDAQVNHLFYPGCQSISRYGGKILNNDAAKEEVLSNLKIFIEKNSN